MEITNRRITRAEKSEDYLRASYYYAAMLIRHGIYKMGRIATTRSPVNFSAK